MKKFLVIFFSITGFVLLAAAIVPLIYQDEIKAAIDQQLDSSVNADINFDHDRFSLSFFRNFPNLTASIGGLEVVNRPPFQGDTLAVIDEVAVELNLFSLFGEAVEVSGVYARQPRVLIKTLEDGRANWDIALADSAATEEPAATESSLRVSVDHWQIEDGYLAYEDQSLNTFFYAAGMNHTGSGDFTLDVFDMNTLTTIDNFRLVYEEVAYMENKQVFADARINMDLSDVFTFTFKENLLKINDFATSFDGWFSMPEDRFEMDINFAAAENSFKSLLSLVPGMFLEGYEDLQTSGQLQFDGFVKGVYSEEQMPGFKLNLLVKDGMFKYPDLPEAVEDIQVDMLVDNTSGVLDNMVVDLKQFRMNLGKNPVSGSFRVAGLTNYDIKADVDAQINLGDLTTMIPLEGMELAGLFTANVKADGVYSETAGTMPTVDALLSLANGQVKYAEYPVPLKNIEVRSSVKNATGQLKDTEVLIDRARMLVGDEPFAASGKVTDLEAINYQFDVTGKFDLALVNLLYPLDEGMQLNGLITADVHTAGSMAAIENEQYNKLPTRGRVMLNDFTFASADLPQGVTIATAEMQFDPKKVQLLDYQGTVGESDMQLNGTISNYLAFALKENEVLQGNFAMKSRRFNTNEWLTEEEAAATDTTAEETYEPVAIPKNLDLRFDAEIGEVQYTNLNMSNMKGTITVKDGIMNMQQLKFGLLGGQFAVNGSYNTTNPEDPGFAFGLDISQLSFKNSYQAFNTVQAFAPIAQNINGKFSTNFSIAGQLGKDFMPVYETLTGNGKIFVDDAAIQDFAVLNKLSELTSISELNNPRLKDIVLQARITDGKMQFQPFDFALAGIESTVQGYTSFSGGISYDLKMDVPASMVSQGFASKLASFTGSEQIPLSFNIGGTYSDPKVALVGSPQQQLAEGTKDQIKEKAGEQIKDLLGTATDTSTTTTEKKEQLENVVDEAKEKLKEVFPNPFKKSKSQKDTTSNQQ